MTPLLLAVLFQQLPLIEIPDTRALVDVRIEAAAATHALQLMALLFPAEGAVCFYGTLSPMTNAYGVQLVVDSVGPASADSANVSHIWFPFNSGCAKHERLVGSGHSHPFSTCNAASFSDADVWRLTENKGLLFTSIWCFDGTLAILWQGGVRREAKYTVKKDD